MMYAVKLIEVLGHTTPKEMELEFYKINSAAYVLKNSSHFLLRVHKLNLISARTVNYCC